MSTFLILFFIILRYVCHLKENKNKFYTWVGKHFGNEERLPRISLDCEFAVRRAL